MRRFCLTAVALVIYAAPAMAQDTCTTPYAPTVPNGATATRDQITAARNQVMAFLKAADEYQACLKVSLEQEAQTAIRERREPHAALIASIHAKDAANMREKVRTGNELNAAIRAFNAAHPAPEN
jgi:hypothetical protein